MSEFRIRDARGNDKFAVGRLWKELMTLHAALDPRFTIAVDGEAQYVRHVQEMIRSRDARVLVAEVVASGEIVGYLMGEVQHRSPMALPGTYGFISDVYVAERWRRHGVGRVLVNEIKSWFMGQKAEAIQLYAADANPSASAFWRAMGFQTFLNLMHEEIR